MERFTVEKNGFHGFFHEPAADHASSAACSCTATPGRSRALPMSTRATSWFPWKQACSDCFASKPSLFNAVVGEATDSLYKMFRAAQHCSCELPAAQQPFYATAAVDVDKAVYRHSDGARTVFIRMLGVLQPATSETRATSMRFASRHRLGDMPQLRAKAAEKLVAER